MHQSIIDRVLLFKKIKIKQKMIKYNIYSTKFDIPKNLILKHDQRMLFYIFHLFSIMSVKHQNPMQN